MRICIFNIRINNTVQKTDVLSTVRFVIMQVMLEAGQSFLKVEQVEGADGQPDLLITMDRTKVSANRGFRSVSTFYGSGSRILK